MLRLTIIVAATKSNGIGQNAGLPWQLPREMKYFAQVTTATQGEGMMNAVLMGRNTWESIPKKYRPLSRRVNLVTSRNPNYELESSPDVPSYLHSSLASVLGQLNASQFPKIFVIGGASLYSDALALTTASSAVVDRILLTRILTEFKDCDVFMPDFIKDGQEAGLPWTQSSHRELEEWVGFKVPEGMQEEKGVQYEYQMWTRFL